jgi:uncharacterized protein
MACLAGEDFPVLFNVSQLLQEPIGAERSYAVHDTITGAGEDPAPVDVDGTVRLVRTNRGLLAYADLDTVVRLACSRCLRPVETPVHLTIEEEFLPTVDIATGHPLPKRDDDDTDLFEIDEHHHVDLTEAVRQALVVSEPMRPLCRAECAGLCNQCGADLNEGACACPEEPADDRWAALRALKLNDE